MQNESKSNIGKIYQLSKDIFEPKPSLIINLNSRPGTSKNFETSSFVEHKSYLKADYNFKHVSKFELEAILKRVRRTKKKQQDLDNWNFYMKSKLEKDAEEMRIKSSNDLISNNEITNCVECGLLTRTNNFFGQSSECQEESLGVKENVPEAVTSSLVLKSSTIDVNQSHNYQLGPVLTKRLQDLLDVVRKMTTVLLSPCLGTQHEDEDIDRTIKRSLEFDAMFTRNHLYEIQRLLKDIKQTMSGKTVTRADLENKISAILKSVAQALQVYVRHVSKGSRVKYQQVVPIFQCIATTQSILENLCGQRLFPMRQDLDVSCSYLKQVLLEVSATETRSMTTISHKTPKIRLRHKPSTDLSMYSRRQREWRRKTASLARARFGQPGSKKQIKKSDSGTKEKVASGCLNKNVSSERNVEGSNSNTVMTGMPSKELPFRNATRAVPEERVTTMMETIPQETLDTSEFYIDDSAFQALKLLTKGYQPVMQESNDNIEETKAADVRIPSDNFHGHNQITQRTNDNIEETKADDVQIPSDHFYCHKQIMKGTNNIEETRAADVKEHVTTTALKHQEENVTRKLKSGIDMTNVQLVCVTERCDVRNSTYTKDNKECEQAVGSESKTLTIEDSVRAELLEYQRKMNEYQESSPLYKDDKAIGIIDRLASRFLKEMLIDFQQNEMEQVIRTLYDLEFE